jgi:hypothetical protein
MPVYFEYTLKVSLCIAIVFLFYALLLRRITHYTWNRHFLLISTILSFIVPFVNINAFLKSPDADGISFIAKIPKINTGSIPIYLGSNTFQFYYWQTASAFYILVSAILCLRLLIQILSIRKIRLNSTLLVDGKVKIYHVSKSILPFSFFNNIFINNDNYCENELREILDHERVHVQQKHSFDTLLTEIVCIINWYNPFAWLIKKAVRENLEFIADHAVIAKGADKKNYQYLLLKVTGSLPSAFTCSFKFSSIKNRISMMNRTKTSRFHLLKFALVVPVIVFILFSFRNSEKKESNTVVGKNSGAETFTLSTLTYSIPNGKVKAIVFKERDKSLLKAGQLFNLTMISDEKNRLRNLLLKNGYKRLSNNAITFLIDSSSTEKSFSVQVNINVEASVSAKGFVTTGRDLAEVNYAPSFWRSKPTQPGTRQLLRNHEKVTMQNSPFNYSGTPFSI